MIDLARSPEDLFSCIAAQMGYAHDLDLTGVLYQCVGF